jgi:hypothetical protein
MKITTARDFFSIPAPNSQDGYIFIAPGDEVFVGLEVYPALPPAFPSGRAVVVIRGNGIGLVDASKVVLKGDSYTEE